MIDRVLYALTATALLCVFMFDQNFATNLTGAFSGAELSLPSDSWTIWVGGIFAVLAAAAFYRERRG